jgi:hypothetical protein
MTQMDSPVEASFSCWANEWMELARFKSRTLSDAPERIKKILSLWDRLIPDEGSNPQIPKRLFGASRYTRGNVERNPDGRGEHAIEYAILNPNPMTCPTLCLGKRLIDGINAVPLAKDVGGGRRGNVEADLLLLVQNDMQGYELQLIEVKAASNAWYAVVEILRQLKHLGESQAITDIFQSHRQAPHYASNLPVTAVVLGPPTFFNADGQKKNAVDPARNLMAAFESKGARVKLAIWDAPRRAILPLGS